MYGCGSCRRNNHVRVQTQRTDKPRNRRGSGYRKRSVSNAQPSSDPNQRVNTNAEQRVHPRGTYIIPINNSSHSLSEGASDVEEKKAAPDKADEGS
ncbi:MAG: hypothetical protein HRT70_09390, partial [Flavobacteriaceae bacterium]|nr:hypothetical protein [Flavobacteriaceae bacterium]